MNVKLPSARCTKNIVSSWCTERTVLKLHQPGLKYLLTSVIWEGFRQGIWLSALDILWKSAFKEIQVFFNCFIVVQVQLSAFTLPQLPCHCSHPRLLPLIAPLPPPTPPRLGFVHESFIVVPENASLPFPALFPPTSPLVTLKLFLILMTLVVFCLLVCFVD